MAKSPKGGNKSNFGLDERGGAGVLKNPKDANAPSNIDAYSGEQAAPAPERDQPRMSYKAQYQRGEIPDVTENIEDFDFGQYSNFRGKTQGGEGMEEKHINNMEMKLLLGQMGDDPDKFTAKEINNFVKEKGMKVGANAQKTLNKALSALGSKTRTDITDPMDGSEPVMDTTPIEGINPLPVPSNPAQPVQKPISGEGTQPSTVSTVSPTQVVSQEIEQRQQVGSNKNNNNAFENTFTGDNYGSVNQGIIDNSINLGAQNASNSNSQFGNAGGGVLGNGAMGFGGGGLDNFASAATTMGLIGNMHERSKLGMMGTAANLIQQGNKLTGARDRAWGLDQQASRMGDIYEAKSFEIQDTYLGDIGTWKPPSWTQTADPEKHETDFKKTGEEAFETVKSFG